MKIAVKSALAAGAIALAATFSAPMAQAGVDKSDVVHSGSYGTQSTQREATKHEPSTKTSRHWGPSQFG
ncbi:hypothetical protein NGTWS0302_16550 [Mycolicibacterium cyprinidarum]|uniref:DUF680 domain-containing protein n=1 Tax=Mycolicibacterium cyprinidarum TaxID=2860311 RepID=A0ABQ4V6D1_9MYCO|nr:hypothetical protein NGTWS1702_33890 [Mycolicibacterium sp. NGTWSNA01]GJF16448.1 hypothetical protein NGTWS1803_02700 [Mycolicibacterium sp. NGTWS1803]GJF18410.1 hypothetical protein NGTWS0302_16550 [Mycolicibacterium sp. NGTWS0302]